MIIALLAAVATATCTLEQHSVRISWTAFKTNQKMAVSGSFTKVKVEGKTKAESLSKLIQGLKVTIDPASVQTGNPGRDATIAEAFFKKIDGISGEVVSISEKTLTLALQFNKQLKNVPLHLTVTNKKNFQATGSIDIRHFQAQDALQSLSERCQDLHRGPDGASKTWPDVELSLSGTINCG